MASARPLESRPRRRAVAVAAVLLALGVAGCGGSEVEYQEVPGEPAEITLPDRIPEPTSAEGDEDAATGDATPTPTATPDPATGATTDGTTTDESASAEATPAPAEDGAANDEPPVPGSDAERFEDFCEQNAGAC
jgi:hypothetical protein